MELATTDETTAESKLNGHGWEYALASFYELSATTNDAAANRKLIRLKIGSLIATDGNNEQHEHASKPSEATR